MNNTLGGYICLGVSLDLQAAAKAHKRMDVYCGGRVASSSSTLSRSFNVAFLDGVSGFDGTEQYGFPEQDDTSNFSNVTTSAASPSSSQPLATVPTFSQTNGVSTFAFSRLLRTGDARDVDLSPALLNAIQVGRGVSSSTRGGNSSATVNEVPKQAVVFHCHYAIHTLDDFHKPHTQAGSFPCVMDLPAPSGPMGQREYQTLLEEGRNWGGSSTPALDCNAREVCDRRGCVVSAQGLSTCPALESRSVSSQVVLLGLFGALLTLLLLYLLLRCVFTLKKQDMPLLKKEVPIVLAVLLTIFDFVTDCLFVWTLSLPSTPAPRLYLYLSLGTLALPTLLNIAFIF